MFRRRAEAAVRAAGDRQPPVRRAAPRATTTFEMLRLGRRAGLQAAGILELQRLAGNQATAGLIVQRDEARRSHVRTRSSSWPKVPRVAEPVAPGSVAELKDMLQAAENMLVDPSMLNPRDRQQLYGHPKSFADWKPDTAGCLQRLDYALDFVRPLVDAKNIASHGNDSTQATVLGLYHTTEWLQGAKADFDEARKARAGVTSESAASAVADVAHRVNTLLAWRDAAKLKTLADEELSFELELGSNPRPAQEYRPELRSQFQGGADLSKREVRVLSWLQANKKLILDAEHEFVVDRLAIAAPIAWEAMHNIMSGGLRGVGPGKMHTYANKWAGVLPLSKGDAVPQQLEEQGYVPKPKDDEDRLSTLVSPAGAISYIGAAMSAAKHIAGKYGYDITHNIVALTSFYQGHDLTSWEDHMKEKKEKRERTWTAEDPMAVWASTHVEYLNSVLSSFGRRP